MYYYYLLLQVEWSMRDEMAAGLLKDLTATPDTLEKIIEHVTNSPYSLSNEHEKIAVNFVVASPETSKYNSESLFLQVRLKEVFKDIYLLI